MKKLLKFLFLLLAGVVIVNSCREDGEWEDNNNTGIYGFTVDRDTDFIEKSVGETNQLKFNIKTKYDFSTIPMKLKYTTNLDGVLLLDGKELEQNKEYIISKADNVLEYVGNEKGTHELKISVKNDKEASLVEEFSLPYSVSEFAVSIDGGKGDIYQSEYSTYSFKITPEKKNSLDTYSIKFLEFNGNIKMNDVPVELNKDYQLSNIDLFTISLSSNVVGLNRLDYEIRNTTVKRTMDLQYNVLQRKINIESMSLSQNEIEDNKELTIIGLLSKSPKSGNLSVKYKTWISSASNGNQNGIDNTNNQWVDYVLSSNGSFTYRFLTKEAGKYTYNVQFQDEFGNLSEVQSFEINVRPNIDITSFKGTLFVEKRQTRFAYKESLYKFEIDIKAHSNVSDKIKMLRLEFEYYIHREPHKQSYDVVVEPSETIDRTISNMGPNGGTRWGHTIDTKGNWRDAICYVTVITENGTQKQYKYNCNFVFENR